MCRPHSIDEMNLFRFFALKRHIWDEMQILQSEKSSEEKVVSPQDYSRIYICRKTIMTINKVLPSKPLPVQKFFHFSICLKDADWTEHKHFVFGKFYYDYAKTWKTAILDQKLERRVTRATLIHNVQILIEYVLRVREVHPLGSLLGTPLGCCPAREPCCSARKKRRCEPTQILPEVPEV